MRLQAGQFSNFNHGLITAEERAAALTSVRHAAGTDRAGLGALIEGYRTASAHGADFRVVDSCASFRRVLEVTGLSAFFGLAEAGSVARHQGERSEATRT